MSSLGVLHCAVCALSSKDMLLPCLTPEQFIGKEKLNENKMTPERITGNVKKQNFVMLCNRIMPLQF
jgi:hypothetical protein